MSRRKQSNPKPLKYEENWNENEDGRKSVKNTEAEEKDAVDGCCVGSPKSSCSLNNSEDAETKEEFRDNPLSAKGVKPARGLRDDSDKDILVSSIKTEKVSEDEMNVTMTPTSGNNSHEQKHQNQRIPVSPDEDRGHSSSASGDLLGSSECSNGPSEPYSQDQLVQAGIPYLHLLPPSIRNDAARFFFMPPTVSPEMASAVGSESAHLHHKGKPVPPESPVTRMGPVYMCEPCNIKFSSANTLEAHQTYYCSSRKEMADKETGAEGKAEARDGDLKHESRDTPSVGSVGGRKRERESSGDEHELSIDERPEGISINTNATSSLPTNKNVKVGKLYSCSYCSYSADKKVSLNRHMRMHSGGPPPIPPSAACGAPSQNGESVAGPSSANPSAPFVAGPGRNIPEGITAADRYCFDCEIQFNSLKTFKVHKQYYCSTRHVMRAAPTASPAVGGCGPNPVVNLGPGAPSPRSLTPGVKLSGAGSPVSLEGSPIPIGSPIPPQPFVVLPTNPVIIVPYCFIQGASVVPGNLLPSTNALVILPNGAVQNLPGTKMPISFPSPGGGGPMVMPGPFGLPEISPTGTTNHNNLSPPGQHSVFNDPKEVIRRICKSSTKNLSAPGDTFTLSDSHPIPTQRPRRPSTSQKAGNVEIERYERNGEESITPAIDLTLRTSIKKEVGRDEDEKENQHADRHLGIPSHLLSQGTCVISRHDAGSEMELRHENAGSPSRQSQLSSGGSTHSGHRTPRPPSISSSCSSSPAPIYRENKSNGKSSRNLLPPVNSRQYTEAYVNGSTRPMINSNKSREKMSPITTQLPGGAILTTASNQSLAELLMTNPSDLNESLAKLNSHFGLPATFDPSTVMAAASTLPPELAMTYLTNIQQSIQQQQIQAVAKQQQQASIKRGVWKCVDCEIVFYKQENFLVHKEAYCASRPIGNSAAEGKMNTKESNSRGFKSKEIQGGSKGEVIVSRSSSSLGESSPPPRRESQGASGCGEINTIKKSPAPLDEKGQIGIDSESQFRINSESPSLLPSPARIPSPASHTVTSNHIKSEVSSPSPPSSYACQKCGIKYNALDNLTTHQTFYCNKRPTPSLSPEGDSNFPSPQRKSSSSNLEKADGFTRCGRCNLAIPEEQMSLHKPVCVGQVNGSGMPSSNTPSASSGWKCPCCDTYSPTMSAAQKHLETHTGIRAFKCVICGYRGNTLRGMRTHIRMHFDKRSFSDLQEGDYISCITTTDLETAGQSHSTLTTGVAGTVNGALNKRRNRVTLVG